MKIVLATANPGKVREFRELSSSLSELELLPAPDGFNPEETGASFLENATIKAQAAAVLTKMPAVADDSGLVVDALNGKPGIHSARYCDGSDHDRCKKLLKEMAAVPESERAAAFVCAIVLVDAQGQVLHQVQEYWKGAIAFTEAGNNGFGYDPVFIVEGCDVTSAQLSLQEKTRISHRAQAWFKMIEFIKIEFIKVEFIKKEHRLGI